MEACNADMMMGCDASELLEMGQAALARPWGVSRPTFEAVVHALGVKAKAESVEALAELCLGLERRGAWPDLDPMECQLKFCGSKMDPFVAKVAKYLDAASEGFQARIASSSKEDAARWAAEASRVESAVGACLASRWRRFPERREAEVPVIAALPEFPAAVRAAAESLLLADSMPEGARAAGRKPTL